MPAVTSPGRAARRRRSGARGRLLPAALAGLLVAGPLVARQERPLVVGTKPAAPFSLRGDDGEWRGVSIDLWRAIAADLGLEYELREASLTELVEGLVEGRLDASVAALTVTSDRVRRVDFSHPFHPSGLGIAVARRGSASPLAVVTQVLSGGFLRAVGTLVVVLLLGGAVLWLLERRRNPEQFGGSTLEGLGAAFWWSAVTMTTVGYGDKAPRTAAGRAMAIVWMFAGVITISSLTAAIASALTVSRLESSITSPDNLHDLERVACVRGSTGEAYLREQRIPRVTYADARGSLTALAGGEARAVVYDAPILSYLSLTEFEGEVTVLPVTFERQDYAIGLPLGSPLRKAINAALLEHVGGRSWEETLVEYLGAAR